MHYRGGGRYEPRIKKGIHRNDVDGLRGGNLRLQSVPRSGTRRAAAGGTGATVSVERDGVASDCGNREQIGELLSILGGMEPTNLQSMQDFPQSDEYTSIHFEDIEGRCLHDFLLRNGRHGLCGTDLSGDLQAGPSPRRTFGQPAGIRGKRR